MNKEALSLLQRLQRTRPRPSEAALKELLVAIKTTPLEEILGLLFGNTSGNAASSSIEASLKQRIRKVGGKAADFVPYLIEEISIRATGSAKLELPRKPTLAAAVAAAEQILGQSAKAATDKAFEKYVEENDVSYQLKSA